MLQGKPHSLPVRGRYTDVAGQVTWHMQYKEVHCIPKTGEHFSYKEEELGAKLYLDT